MNTKRSDEWQELIEWYSALIHKNHWRQEPMLDFVRWLHASEFAAWIHPSQSHEALGLSRVSEYSERRMRPMVYVRYLNSELGFEVVFQEGQGNTVNSVRTYDPRDPATMNGIIDWLNREVVFAR
jgi:hypothetical protein